MHVFARAGCRLACLCLALLSLSAHALNLGNLTVSSNASTSFTASLPFSDDKPVRLPELQARLATDAEYAKWGMTMAPVVRELQVRVVPASQTVGNVELFSPTALSQDNFDLLVWASYAGQTVLTHYKVRLLDVPSFIKGKTLSTSQAQANTWQGQDWPPKAGLDKPKKAAPASKTTAPAPTVEAAPAKPIDTPINAPQVAQALPQPVSPPSVAAVVNASKAVPASQANTDSVWGSGGLLLVFSLVLFLFGFLVGRMRGQPAAPSLPGLTRHAAAAPGLNSGRNPQASPRPSSAKPRSPQPNMPVFNTLPLIQPLPISPLPVSPLPVSPQLFSPLPTPFNLVQPVKADAPVASPTPSEVPNLPPIAEVVAPAAPAPECPPVSAAPTEPALPPEAPVAQAPLAPTLAAPIEPIQDTEPVTTPQAQRLQAEPLETSEAPEQVPVVLPPSNPVDAVTVVARTPATALPTPGRGRGAARRKAGKTKSAGDSNIDLAKIYLSMGDPTTAQMVLQQVMEQGTEAEKAQAEQLMQEMV